MKHNSALSLVEVMVASLIFVSVMVGVVTAATKSMEYAILSEMRDDMAIEATKIFDQIEEDLSRSAWYFPAVPGANPTEAATYTSSADFRLDGEVLGDDWVEDRAMRYYPMVKFSLMIKRKQRRIEGLLCHYHGLIVSPIEWKH